MSESHKSSHMFKAVTNKLMILYTPKSHSMSGLGVKPYQYLLLKKSLILSIKYKYIVTNHTGQNSQSIDFETYEQINYLSILTLDYSP